MIYCYDSFRVLVFLTIRRAGAVSRAAERWTKRLVLHSQCTSKPRPASRSAQRRKGLETCRGPRHFPHPSHEPSNPRRFSFCLDKLYHDQRPKFYNDGLTNQQRRSGAGQGNIAPRSAENALGLCAATTRAITAPRRCLEAPPAVYISTCPPSVPFSFQPSSPRSDKHLRPSRRLVPRRKRRTNTRPRHRPLPRNPPPPPRARYHQRPLLRRHKQPPRQHEQGA